MAEYRIIAKLDPAGVASGRAKIRQELTGLDADVQRTAARSSGALDKMTAAEFRAAGGAEGLAKQAKAAAASQSQLESATRRVLDAVDKEAAAQLRLNTLLKDAKLALDAGRISHEQYNRVQKLAADGLKTVEQQSGRTRAGLTQLSFQVGDVAQGLAMGTRASTIFAQQSGQVIQSLQVMGGQGNAFLKFIGGPWGIALSTAAVVLTPFIGKLFDSGDAISQATDKLKEDSKQSEIDRLVHERWIHTLDALIDRQGQLADKMRDRLKIQGLANESDLQAAQKDLGDLSRERDQIARELRDARARQGRVQATIQSAPRAEGGPTAPTASAADAEIARLEGRLKRIDTAIGNANKRITGGLILTGEEQGKAMADLTAKAQHWGDLYQDALRGIEQRNKGVLAQAPEVNAAFEIVNKSVSEAASAGVHFDATLDRAKQLGVALDHGKTTVAAYGSEMRKLATQLDAATKAAKDAKNATDGVEKFRTRQQAIGIAGRELQSAGLRVDGNVQFGYTSGHANDNDHNQFAIDVNAGKGVVEANVPDLKKRFDALAVSYQRRGYDVIWNGQKYPAFGNGPSGPAKGHDNHLHIYAAQTIVGHPTHSSDFAQEQRDYRTETTTAQQATDYVNRIVTQAANRGQGDRASALKTRIQTTLDEYRERFKDLATDAGAKKITEALTAADAREIADHFNDAYVEPLKLLEAQLGKTALEREILTAKQKEAADLGRALKPEEEAAIERRYRYGDQLEREDKILQGIRRPLEEYRQQLSALNDLLAKGEINQNQFNSRVAELNSPLRQVLNNAPAGYGQPGGVNVNDPNPGGKTSNYQTFGEAGQAMDENARYSAELDQLDQFRKQFTDSNINWDAIEEAAHQQHIDKLNAIDDARRATQLGAAQSIADSLLSIAGDTVGKQSQIYRTLFAISKAFTIAQAALALYQNVAQAMKVGFPQNLPLIAAAFAQGATIVAAIKGITTPGFERGGYTGNASRGQQAGVVHGQEFVVNADATARHRALLEAMNSGQLNARAQAASNDNPSMGFRPVMVKVENHAPGVEFETARGATPDEVVLIARRVAREEAPGAVAADMGRPNGKTSKAMGQHFGVGRRRS